MPAASSGSRGGKRRKMSSAKDTESVPTGNQKQPEISDDVPVTADAG